MTLSQIFIHVLMCLRFIFIIVFLLLLKLELFLLICFQTLNLVFLFNDPEEQTRNIIFQSIMVASVIPMVGLALWGVCQKDFFFLNKKNNSIFIIFYFF